MVRGVKARRQLDFLFGHLTCKTHTSIVNLQFKNNAYSKQMYIGIDKLSKRPTELSV